MRFDDKFQKYLDLGRELTAFYYEERYPPGPMTSYTNEEVEETLEEAEEFIDKLNEGIKR